MVAALMYTLARVRRLEREAKAAMAPDTARSAIRKSNKDAAHVGRQIIAARMPVVTYPGDARPEMCAADRIHKAKRLPGEHVGTYVLRAQSLWDFCASSLTKSEKQNALSVWTFHTDLTGKGARRIDRVDTEDDMFDGNMVALFAKDRARAELYARAMLM